MHVVDSEADHADVCVALECIDPDRFWQGTLERLYGDGPMREQQLPPSVVHEPRTWRLGWARRKRSCEGEGGLWDTTNSDGGSLSLVYERKCTRAAQDIHP